VPRQLRHLIKNNVTITHGPPPSGHALLPQYMTLENKNRSRNYKGGRGDRGKLGNGGETRERTKGRHKTDRAAEEAAKHPDNIIDRDCLIVINQSVLSGK